MPANSFLCIVRKCLEYRRLRAHSKIQGGAAGFSVTAPLRLRMV